MTKTEFEEFLTKLCKAAVRADRAEIAYDASSEDDAANAHEMSASEDALLALRREIIDNVSEQCGWTG